MRAWRIAAVAAVLAGYGLVSYWLTAYAPQHAWTVLTLFGPTLVALGLFGLQRRHKPTLALVAVLALGLVAVAARGGMADMSRLYVLQHAALHGALAWSFGLTLRPGHTPLITAMAQRVHVEPLTPELRAYTRWLTGVWVVYFIVLIGVSLAVYALAPWAVWSFVGNVVSPLAAVALFVGEYLVRYRLHPEFERTTLSQAMQAWRARDPKAHASAAAASPSSAP